MTITTVLPLRVPLLRLNLKKTFSNVPADKFLLSGLHLFPNILTTDPPCAAKTPNQMPRLSMEASGSSLGCNTIGVAKGKSTHPACRPLSISTDALIPVN
jgi:hypothetical protein